MRPWLPLAVVLALVALPAGAAQTTYDGTPTTTSLRADGPVQVEAGTVTSIKVQVEYTYTAVPSLQPTPTDMFIEEAPEDLKLAFSPTTVYHPTDEFEPQAGTTRTSHAVTQISLVAPEDGAGSGKISILGHSRGNGPHAPSEGTAQILVKVVDTEVASASSSDAQTQEAGLAPGPGVPVQALVGLVAAGGLAVGVVRAAGSD